MKSQNLPETEPKPQCCASLSLHVIPVGGTERLHVASRRCWCYPLLKENGVMRHNAEDCREKYERAGIERPDLPWVVVAELVQ